MNDHVIDQLAQRRAHLMAVYADALAALVADIESDGFVVTVEQNMLSLSMGHSAPEVTVREGRAIYNGVLRDRTLLCERTHLLAARRPRDYSAD